MKVFFIIIFLILPFCFCFADDLPDFDEWHTQVIGKIEKVLVIDVNADEYSEVVYQKGMNIFILYYSPDVPGYFSVSRCSIIHLKPEDALWCFGDVADGPEMELIVVNGDGISYYSIFEAQKPIDQVKDSKQLIQHPTVFRTRLTESSERTIEKPIYKEFALDANGDKRTDIIIPDFKKYIFYTQETDKSFRLNQRINIENDAHIQLWGEFLYRMSHTISFPKFYFRDFDCDGRNDFMIFKGNILYVYRCREDRIISATPTDEIVVDVMDRAKLKKIKKRKYIRYEFDIPPFIDDVNNDGMIDIILSNVNKGRCLIFLGKSKEKSQFDNPDQIIELDGWLISQFFKDVNGDSQLDLLLVRVPKLGFWEVLNVFAAKAIDIEGLVFLNRPDGKFGAQIESSYDFKKDITIPFVLSFSSAELLKVTSSYIIDLGDMNGDGCTDLFIKTSDNEFTVYKGSRSGKIGAPFNKRLKFELDTTKIANSTTYVNDINCDSISDVVLWHSDFHDVSNYLHILMSRKR